MISLKKPTPPVRKHSLTCKRHASQFVQERWPTLFCSFSATSTGRTGSRIRVDPYNRSRHPKAAEDGRSVALTRGVAGEREEFTTHSDNTSLPNSDQNQNQANNKLEIHTCSWSLRTHGSIHCPRLSDTCMSFGKKQCSPSVHRVFDSPVAHQIRGGGPLGVSYQAWPEEYLDRNDIRRQIISGGAYMQEKQKPYRQARLHDTHRSTLTKRIAARAEVGDEDKHVGPSYQEFRH